jgi:hypothetical protein
LQRHGPYICTVGGSGRKQWRLRVQLVQILDNRERLRQNLRAILESWHQSIGVELAVDGRKLLAPSLEKMHRCIFIR